MADSTSKYLLLVLRIYKQIKTDFEGLTRYQKLKSAMILNCSSLEPKRQGLGLAFAGIAQIALLFALVGVLRNAGTSAFDDLDALLLRIPIVATIYEDWFRVDTYYREDTRGLYVKLLPKFILDAAEEICGAKGVKLVRQHQYPPILQELFQPLPPRKDEPK